MGRTEKMVGGTAQPLHSDQFQSLVVRERAAILHHNPFDILPNPDTFQRLNGRLEVREFHISTSNEAYVPKTARFASADVTTTSEAYASACRHRQI